MFDPDEPRRYVMHLVHRSLDGRGAWSEVQGLTTFARRSLRPSEVDPVRSALRTIAVSGPTIEVRGRALLGLSRIWRPEDVALAEAVAADPAEAPRLRALAVIALTKTPDLDAMFTTVTAIMVADTAHEVRVDGVRALRGRLDHERQLGNQPAVKAIVDRAGALAQEWVKRPELAWLVWLAVNLLHAVRHDRVPGMCVALAHHPDTAVRYTVLRVIARYPEHDTVSLALTRDPDPRVRRVAAGNLRGRTGQDVLIRLDELLDDENESVRYQACTALVESPAADIRPRLRAWLHSPRKDVRHAVLTGVASAPDDHTEAIATLLDHPSRYTRRLAVECLGRSMSRHRITLGASSPLLPRLVRMLAEPDSQWLEVTIQVAFLVLDRTPLGSESDSSGAGDLVAPLTAILDRCADTANLLVRAALRLLGMLGDATALPAVERWRPGPEPARRPGVLYYEDLMALPGERDRCLAEQRAACTRLENVRRSGRRVPGRPAGASTHACRRGAPLPGETS